MSTQLAKNLLVRGNYMVGMDQILSMPRAQVICTTQNITANVLSFVTWNVPSSTPGASTYDTDGMWSSATPTRLTARTAGVFLYCADVFWQDSAIAGTYRQILLWKNGASGFGQNIVPGVTSGGIGTEQTTAWPIPMNAGDYVEVGVVQSAVNPLQVLGAAGNSMFAATLISTP